MGYRKKLTKKKNKTQPELTGTKRIEISRVLQIADITDGCYYYF